MIHTLLNLTRPLFVLDTETTGLDRESSRIIEFGFQQWMTEGLLREWRSYINPCIEIPANTTKVHGIDNARMLRCNACNEERLACQCEHFHPVPRFVDIAVRLARGMSDCDFAGKNIRFDLGIMESEFRRCRIEWNYTGARIVDIDRLEAIAYPRDLASLHKKYAGKEHEGAHGAISDVRASTTVILMQLQEHEALLPRDLDELHTLQWPGWITACGRFRMLDGEATCFFGKHKYTPMKSVPLDYYDFILRGSFPADVKTLAAKAKMGEYPK